MMFGADCKPDENDFVGPDCLATPISGPDSFSDQSQDDTYVTGRAVLKYQITEEHMVYASYATGYKSGGYNQLRTDGQATDQRKLWFEPENSGSIELGLRTSWFDRMLTFNITGFYTNYDDFQSQVFDGLGIRVENAGNFISTGFETDLTIVPLPGWITVFSAGYTYTEYKKFPEGPCTQEQTLLTPFGTPCIQDLGGRRLDGTPRWNVAIFTAYESEIPNVDANWYVQMDYNYQSWRYLNASLDEKLKADPVNQVGLRLGFRDPESIWDISAWVKNVTDDNFWVMGFDVPTVGGYAAFIAPPRTFGGTLRVKF
jgi:iron complex outermembrane receptor protein